MSWDESGSPTAERLYAARYASEGMVNTLDHSAGTESLRRLYPVGERFAPFGPGARVVVSEPLVALTGLRHEVPAGSALTVEEGRVDLVPFTPRRPDHRLQGADRAGERADLPVISVTPVMWLIQFDAATAGGRRSLLRGAPSRYPEVHERGGHLLLQ